MIQINLRPGDKKKSRRQAGASAAGALAAVGAVASKVKDPFLIAAVIAVTASSSVVISLYLKQAAREKVLVEHEARAVHDSARFAAVLKDWKQAQARRDSILRQLDVIKSIDNDRFVWAHIMDEVSRALPPYTWLKTVQQAAATPVAAAPAPEKGKKEKDKAAKDPVPASEPVKFQIIGNTIDIQALTRFMTLLEQSPFVQHVQLARSELVTLDGKPVTQFTLDAQYERPDPTAITTVPLSLGGK